MPKGVYENMCCAFHAKRLAAITTMLAMCVLVGCQDEQDIKKLTELANSSRSNTNPESQTAPTSQPTPPDKLMPHAGRRLILPGIEGCIEWVHKPSESTARMYFLGSNLQPTDNASSVVMWLTEPTGPKEVAMMTCTPPEPGCWQAKAPALAEAVPHGLVRFEIGRERYGVSLPPKLIEHKSTSQPPLAESATQPPEQVK